MVDIAEDFTTEVFTFIQSTYGKTTLNKTKNKENLNLVNKILSSSIDNDYSVEKTGNKIVAMLRLNP